MGGSLLSSLFIASQALDVDQGAIDVSANNIANANTPGYSREVVDLSENTPVETANLTYGTGVNLEQIQSIRDQVLTLQIAEQTAQQSGAQTELNALQQVEALFSTPSQGIGADISAFFNSVSQLSTDPSNAALRSAVITAAQNLAISFNQTSQSITTNQLTLNQSVSQTVDQINTLTQQIAHINAQVGAMQQLGKDPGGLEDQENQLINQLSQLTSVSETQTQEGLTLTTGNGTALVVGNQSYALQVQTGASGMQDVFSNGQDITSTIQGGILGGTIQVRDQDLPGLLNQLDTLAGQFATSFNTAQAAGFDLNGNPGQALFSVTAGPGAAASFSLATTNANAIAASSDGSQGSNGNVANLMAVSTQPLPSGDTPTNSYAAIVSQSGILAKQAQAEVTASTTSINQLSDQLGAISGVSINEETTNLLNYQNAFSAAARVVSTVAQLTQTVLNMGSGSATTS
ncbi:MAG TPA: flagellar hook-associated protein FlgK [Terriglobales bacterium]|nr:flagellar hook-associated protein FlgK [Terriglobales bacterium]